MSTSVKNYNLRLAFNALGDVTRYRIVELLIDRPELCVSEVAVKIGISTAGVSQHMKILEQSGLVKPQRMGQKTCYQLQTQSAENKTLLSLVK